jgi:hypothetical protein
MLAPFKVKRKAICLLGLMFFLTGPFIAHGQTSHSVFTEDIDRFWTAFDSVRNIHEKDKQVEVMKVLYTDKGTDGLNLFMKLRKFDAARLVETINKYPKFWASIRANTFTIKQKMPLIEKHIRDLKLIYPEMRPARIYFTVTAIRAAGTVQDSVVLIGSEIAMGNKTTDVSEFTDKRLANFFNSQDSDNIIPVVIHEYVHTQQKTESKILLGQAIYEGACDFVTELTLKTTLQNSYLKYGRLHEKELKQAFKEEMLEENFDNWLYNGTTAKTMGDLGYFMGYTICRSYYRHARNKSKALRDIIHLDYSDKTAILAFLEASRYYK